jgi:hypothetical protein
MVDDNLVKELLTEWLVIFGMREVSVTDFQKHIHQNTVYDNTFWNYVVDRKKYIRLKATRTIGHMDGEDDRWQLTDAGIKHLQ